MMAEGLYLLPGEEEERKRARAAWLKAERAALNAARLRSKHGAELVHNLVCECGCEHLVRLTVVSSHISQDFDRTQSRMGADPIESADRGLSRDSQHLLPGFKPKNSVLKVVHHLLRRLVGAFDGKARAGVRQGANPVLRPDAASSCFPNQKEAE